LHDSQDKATHTPEMDGAEMEALLRQIGWTARELAQRLGIRGSTVGDWLNGRRSIPDNVADWLRQVAQVLDQAPALPEGWRSGTGC
jgi:transcriptional regulator with XRE-family HTH domain